MTVLLTLTAGLENVEFKLQNVNILLNYRGQ